MTSQTTVNLVKTLCCSNVRIRYFIEDGKSLEFSEVLQENGDIYRWVYIVFDENNKWCNSMTHHAYRTT